MYRLLIVDDEPYIVNYFHELFMNLKQLDIEIYKAYSGNEALELLNKAKIDIVISDIRMPGIDGIELVRRIRLSWPRCRVILLTAYDSFEYVQSALRYDAVDYILKTEGDDEIVKAVEKAVAEIEKELKDEQLVLKANEHMHLIIPILQREYLLNLMEANVPFLDTRYNRFKELDIPLNPESPVLALTGRVDCWTGHNDPSNRMQLLYSVNGILEQYISAFSIHIFAAYEHSGLLWLIQIKDDADSWEHLVLLVKESLASVQISCKELLNLSVSFVLSSGPVQWDKAGEKFERIKKILNYELGSGKEMLLTDNVLLKPESGLFYDFSATSMQNCKRIRNVGLLETYLENGRIKEFKELYLDVMQAHNSNTSVYFNENLEIYYSVALILLSYINRWGLMSKIEVCVDLSKLTRIEEHSSWDDIIGYFGQIIEIIFNIRQNEQVKRTNEVIVHINKYINEHLNNDLSLVKLAEQVYLNPHYLSRLYKQTTGRNISDYINETKLSRAKELLKRSDIKILEIAAALGYESAPYFTRYFKKETNMTPQEYRDSFIV